MTFRPLLLVAILSSAAVAQPVARIPAKDFGARPSVDWPVLSPDGTIIAARSVVEKQHYLALIAADEPAMTPKRISLGDLKLRAIHWAGNRRLLLEVTAETVFQGEDVNYGRLVSIDLNTGVSQVLDSRSRGVYGGDVLFVADDGATAIVASQDDIYSYPSVKRVDLVTGKAKEIEKPRTDVWDWYVDGRGVVRGGVAYDEKRWKMWYRSNEGEDFRTVSGKLSNDGTAIDRVYFSSDGETGVVLTNEKTGRFAGYNYNFRTGELGDAIYENPQVDVEDLMYDRTSRRITGARYLDTRWRTHWIDPVMAKLQAKIDRALPKGDNWIMGDPDSDKRMLIWSGGASQPGTYYLYDKAAATMSPVILPLDRIDPAQMADVQPIKYRARDGLEINGYLTLPKGRDPKSLPLILMPHGGPFARDDWSYDPIVQFLANRGYAVLQPEFRGSTGYGKDFVAKGFGEWGRKMQDDLDDGVDWLASTGQIDKSRVCIVGASYGGYAALWGVIRNPERYRCAASMAGVTDLEAQLKNNRRSFSAVRYFRQWRTKVQGEGSFDLDSVSPLRQVAKLKRPVLLVHGDKDEVVSFKQGKAMVEAMQKANADVTYAYYKGGGHNFSDAGDMEDFFTKLDAFLAKHNPS